MKIVITSNKPVLIPQGRLPKGIPVEVSPTLANFLIEQGVAVLFETKEVMDRPTEAAGNQEPSLPLPVAPASQETTLSESGNGEKPKRRGRPRKTEQ